MSLQRIRAVQRLRAELRRLVELEGDDMPIFRWRCSKCGKVSEVVRAPDEADQGPKGVCPECWDRKAKFTRVR